MASFNMSVKIMNLYNHKESKNLKNRTIFSKKKYTQPLQKSSKILYLINGYFNCKNLKNIILIVCIFGYG